MRNSCLPEGFHKQIGRAPYTVHDARRRRMREEEGVGEKRESIILSRVCLGYSVLSFRSMSLQADDDVK